MQSFEIPKYEKARQEFEKAFWGGRREGLRRLETGEAERLPEQKSVVHVDVPRDDILDGEWSAHTERFFQAGLTAALAARLHEGPKFVSPGTPKEAESSETAVQHSAYRWTIVVS
jgi:hypothetical protein